MKIRAKIIFLCTLIYIFSSVYLSVGAESAEDQIADGLSGAAESVADSTGSSLADSLATESIGGTGNILLEFLTPEQVLEEIFGIGIDMLPSALTLFCSVAGLVVIASVCNSLCSSLGEGGLSRGFAFLSSSAIIAAIFGVIADQVIYVTDFFDGLTAFIESMVPITGAVMAMGGNVGGATAGSTALYAMLAVTEKLCATAVLPVCCIMAMAAICAGLSDGGMLDGFVGGVKKVYNFVIGLLMTVFLFVLGTQTTITGAADGITARSAKLLSSTVIPGVGGAVGDTLRTVAGSVGYIKSVVGVGGIVLVLILTLPTLISLLLSRLSFLLCSTLADMLGCRRESKLLCELGNIYGFLIGAVAICSVAFIIAFAIFVRCTVALE